MNIVKEKNRHRENGGSFLGVFIFLGWMSHIRSRTRKGRNDVHFDKYPHNCKQSLALFVSSDSFLSAFSRILVRTVSCFCFRILIGYLGILGLLHRRMVVVSHLFRPQRF